MCNSGRDGFGSRFGIVAAAAGSAVGFGNILRFPYQLGTNGGAAFLAIYLCFVVFLGMTGMLCEMSIGRRSQHDVVNAFRTLAPNAPWRYAGFIGIVAVTLILAFYIVLFGWSFNYFSMAVFNTFSGKTVTELVELHRSTTAEVIEPIFYSFLCLAMTGGIVVFGIRKGIEKCARVLMPILFVILIILVLRGITLPGAGKAFAFLFEPDFSKITPQLVLNALGQGLFDLSLGSGIMITYGSYINKKENLGLVVAQTAILNTSVSLLSGIAIFTAVFSYGIAPGAGYALSYITLPAIFQKMTGGYFFAVLFFLLLSVAGLTTSISIIEVVVAYLKENFEISRLKATIIASVVIGTLSVPCALSFGVLKDFTILGKNLFELFDFVSANICNPLASLIWVTFAAWYLGYNKLKDELTSSGTVRFPYFSIFFTTVKYVSPIIIIVVFIRGIFPFLT
jgi:neurotransmitter:Na+ symporter, NSS family